MHMSRLIALGVYALARIIEQHYTAQRVVYVFTYLNLHFGHTSARSKSVVYFTCWISTVYQV